MSLLLNVIKKLYQNHLNGGRKLAIIDDSVPSDKPMGFRNYEFNLILKAMPNADIWTMSVTYPGADAFFKHSYGQTKKIFRDNKKRYLRFYPENKERIHWLNTSRKYSFQLAYSIFLCTTYTLLPFYTNNRIPFVFVLYPGGGFGLNNHSSDKMLRKICSNPYFKGVVCTQPITKDYLLEKQFCSEDKIFYQFCSYVQFTPQDIPQKLYYPKDKDTLDICFVAAKYSPQGVDKGYDLFIKVAKVLVKSYSHLRFHVVGNFNEEDIFVGDLENKINFYGFLQPHQLSELYSKMDVCLSPNRPFKLFEGNFDGFPLGVEAMCFGTLLMTTDELNNNRNVYVDGEELIIIRPELNDIINKLRLVIDMPEKLYDIGRKGACKTFEILDPKERAKNIISFLEKNMMELDNECH